MRLSLGPGGGVGGNVLTVHGLQLGWRRLSSMGKQTVKFGNENG